MYPGVKISKMKDPVPEAIPPFVGPIKSPDNMQAAFPRCIIVCIPNTGTGIRINVDIKTIDVIMETTQILAVVLFILNLILSREKHILFRQKIDKKSGYNN